jgi:hypothetical protein
MNVASAKLSKRLCNLSNWRGTDFCWDDVALPFYSADQEIDGGFPAYDLGFVIRMLPTALMEGRLNRPFNLVYDSAKGSWIARYGARNFHKKVGRSPEDTVCRLAIELIEQGIL